ncbi:MAG: flavoprotein domain protein [Propionibacterium sp.]|nr:flavoprotein domain protein [Propionibacterium sp.]
MTEDVIQEIVRRVIAALTSRAEVTGGERERPSALVLFTGALLGFEDSLPPLARLQRDVDLHAVCTPSAKRILDIPRIDAVGMRHADGERLAAHDLVIVPTLTVNIAAKVAGGIGDCLASNVIAEFLMSGKPVVAARNGVCPDSPDKQGWYPTMPPGYAAMLRETLSRLESMGASLPAAARLDHDVRARLGAQARPHCDDAAPLSLVTAETIRDAAPRSTIHLAPGAIITDLAREAAAERYIVLATTEGRS